MYHLGRGGCEGGCEGGQMGQLKVGCWELQVKLFTSWQVGGRDCNTSLIMVAASGFRLKHTLSITNKKFSMITRLLPQVSEPQTFRYKHGSSTFLSSGINWNLQKNGKFSLLLQLEMSGKIGKENHTIWTKRIGNNPHISMEVRSREKLSNTKRWKWIRNSFPEG